MKIKIFVNQRLYYQNKQGNDNFKIKYIDFLINKDGNENFLIQVIIQL